MVKNEYIPERGDILWMNFNPQSGHEQKGKRPAVVLSLKEYNEKTGLGLFCPITSKIKNYPFEVKLESKKIDGVVLSDQIKNLDWKTRKIEFITKITPEKIYEIADRIGLLLFEEST